MSSSPVAFKYFFHFFFDLLVSLSLLLILCTPGYIYLNLACVYVTNTAPWLISINLHVINSLHADYFLRLLYDLLTFNQNWPGPVVQSVTCLATDASLTADPGVASSIPAQSHTSLEIDHEIISTVILLPSAESFKKGCCQLQAKVCARSTG